MQFGNLIFVQTCGVAMGMAPAPTIANLFIAIYENDHIIPLVGKYLMYYKRFIDNRFAIWLHDSDSAVDTSNWNEFKAICNMMGLRWTFKSLQKN